MDLTLLTVTKERKETLDEKVYLDKMVHQAEKEISENKAKRAIWVTLDSTERKALKEILAKMANKDLKARRDQRANQVSTDYLANADLVDLRVPIRLASIVGLLTKTMASLPFKTNLIITPVLQ